MQTDAHIEKPFMMLNASSRSTVGRDSLIVVLKTMSGIHCENTSTTIPILGQGLTLEDLLNSDDIVQEIRLSLSQFTAEIEGRAGGA